MGILVHFLLSYVVSFQITDSSKADKLLSTKDYEFDEWAQLIQVFCIYLLNSYMHVYNRKERVLEKCSRVLARF